MEELTYLFFYDVDGRPEVLKGIFNIPANKYFCLGNLISSELADPDLSLSRIEESAECVDIFKKKNGAILLKGTAEKTLEQIIKDKDHPNRLAFLVTFQKHYTDYICSAKTAVSNPQHSFCLLPRLPEGAEDLWTTRDLQLLKDEKKFENYPIQLESNEYETWYRGPIEFTLRTLAESNTKDNKFYFLGLRKECVIWQKAVYSLKSFKLKNGSMRIKHKLQLNDKQRHPGKHILTPGSAQLGHYMLLKLPEMELKVVGDGDLRKTQEVNKTDLKKRMKKSKKIQNNLPFGPHPGPFGIPQRP